MFWLGALLSTSSFASVPKLLLLAFWSTVESRFVVTVAEPGLEQPAGAPCGRL